MGILNFLTGEDYKVGDLIHSFENYTKQYELVCENTFVIGKETPPIQLKTVSNIEINQEVVKKKLHTKITTLHIHGETDSNEMKEGLAEALVLGEISPTIVFERNLQGVILEIINKKQLDKDWNTWKNTRLLEVFDDEKVRNRFVRNYEKGLTKMESVLNDNFTYHLIMPECLKYRTYLSNHNPDKNTSVEVYSKLIPNMKLRYQMYLTKVIGKPETADTIHLTSKVHHQEHLKRDFLDKLYAQHPDYTSNQYSYEIKKKYQFDKHTSEIITGELVFEEKMHDTLKYTLNLKLQQLDTNNSGISQIS